MNEEAELIAKANEAYGEMIASIAQFVRIGYSNSARGARLGINTIERLRQPMNRHYSAQEIKALLEKYSNKAVHELAKQCVDLMEEVKNNGATIDALVHAFHDIADVMPLPRAGTKYEATVREMGLLIARIDELAYVRKP